MAKGTYPISVMVKDIPEEVDQIVIQEQAQALAKRGIWRSKSDIIKDILKKYKEQCKILKVKA